MWPVSSFVIPFDQEKKLSSVSSFYLVSVSTSFSGAALAAALRLTIIWIDHSISSSLKSELKNSCRICRDFGDFSDFGW